MRATYSTLRFQHHPFDHFPPPLMNERESEGTPSRRSHMTYESLTYDTTRAEVGFPAERPRIVLPPLEPEPQRQFGAPYQLRPTEVEGVLPLPMGTQAMHITSSLASAPGQTMEGQYSLQPSMSYQTTHTDHFGRPIVQHQAHHTVPYPDAQSTYSRQAQTPFSVRNGIDDSESRRLPPLYPTVRTGPNESWSGVPASDEQDTDSSSTMSPQSYTQFQNTARPLPVSQPSITFTDSRQLPPPFPSSTSSQNYPYSAPPPSSSQPFPYPPPAGWDTTDASRLHRSPSGGSYNGLVHPLPSSPPYNTIPGPSASYQGHQSTGELVSSPGGTPPEMMEPRPKRRRADAAQLLVLNKMFNRTPFPSTEQRIELAQMLGMSPRRVQIWFQNKRQSTRHNQSNTSQ